MPTSREYVREIGFYDCVVLGERTIHVQTEVVEDDNIKIWTQVLEEGTVVNKIVKVYEEPDKDIWQVRTFAELQHKTTVNDVRLGKLN